MTKQVRLVKTLEGWRGNAALYEFNPPLEREWEEAELLAMLACGAYPNISREQLREELPTRFAVLSTVSAMFTGIETMAFASNAEGEVVSFAAYMEIRGCGSHEEILRTYGWEIVDEQFTSTSDGSDAGTGRGGLGII